MRNFKSKTKDRNIMHSVPVLIIFAILVLFFAISLISFIGKMQETSRNKKTAEEKVTELQQQKTQLTSKVDELNTPQGVEDSIREKFGLAKDGEGLIIVLDDQDKTDTATDQKSKGIWPWFKSLFK